MPHSQPSPAPKVLYYAPLGGRCQTVTEAQQDRGAPPLWAGRWRQRDWFVGSGRQKSTSDQKRRGSNSGADRPLEQENPPDGGRRAGWGARGQKRDKKPVLLDSLQPTRVQRLVDYALPNSAVGVLLVHSGCCYGLQLWCHCTHNKQTTRFSSPTPPFERGQGPRAAIKALKRLS